MNTRFLPVAPLVAQAPRSRDVRVFLGVAGCMAALSLMLPWIARELNQTRSYAERLQARAAGPYATLPSDATARSFAGMNAR